MPNTAALRVLKSIGRREAGDSGQRVTQKARARQRYSRFARTRPKQERFEPASFERMIEKE
jgi:hypothetical protein